MTASRVLRRAVGALVSSALAAALLVAVGAASPAQAAVDAHGFQAGNIVSDANFYDSNAMTAAEVQSFLDKAGAACSTNCLKSRVETTVAKPAQTGLCNGYQGGLQQTAAQIIDGVARSCGISQKALIVLLQKEQGLVTIDNPSERRYRSATGQGCPDTAPCDAQFYGFFNQVYGAARQFMVYRYYADEYWYVAGRVNSILYSPDDSCGRTSVFIVNQATAGLYIYTPYTPNAASLDAQWGEGDGCSTYGNRNFYMYWSLWFGDPLSSGPAADISFARSSNPQLGDTRGALTCGLTGGGCRQIYANGAIFWSASARAQVVEGGIWGLYQSAGMEGGTLGYPTGVAAWSTVNGGGWIQSFENGAIYWSSVAGGRVVQTAVYREYVRVGAVPGDLGWPMADYRCGLPRGACIQQFQFGDIYVTSAGAVAIRGGMRETFTAMGGPTGALGYPIGAEQYRTTNGEGWVQAFEGGAVYWRNGSGIYMFGAIRDVYVAAGYNNGPLGWPVSAQTCVATGCRQDFMGGLILWTSPNGAYVVSGGIGETYATEGTQAGRLGYPIGPQTPRSGNGDGWVQAFQSGAIYWRNGLGISMWGGIREQYGREGYNWGRLGWPVSAQVCSLPKGGCQQSFAGGRITWTPELGTITIAGAIAVAYDRVGGVASALGYPLAAQTPREGNGSGVVQAFEDGAIYQRAQEPAYVLSGPIRAEYGRQGYSWGTLGWPVADRICGLVADGCKQQFDTGWIVWSSGSGAVRIDGGLWETWQRMGGESGALGYPTGPAVQRAGGGWQQTFQKGVLAWTGDRGGFVDSSVSQ